MLPTHPSYTPKSKRQVIKLVRLGCNPSELAREFEPRTQTITEIRLE